MSCILMPLQPADGLWSGRAAAAADSSAMGSRRPDGTFRSPRKIPRAGWFPIEEQSRDPAGLLDLLDGPAREAAAAALSAAARCLGEPASSALARSTVSSAAAAAAAANVHGIAAMLDAVCVVASTSGVKLGRRQCEICLCESSTLGCGAGHRFCSGCFREYIQKAAHMNDGRGGIGGELLHAIPGRGDTGAGTSAVGQLPCPFFKSPGCECASLPPATILESFTTHSESRAAADAVGLWIDALQCSIAQMSAPTEPPRAEQLQQLMAGPVSAEPGEMELACVRLKGDVEAALLRGQAMPCPGCGAGHGKDDECIHVSPSPPPPPPYSIHTQTRARHATPTHGCYYDMLMAGCPHVHAAASSSSCSGYRCCFCCCCGCHLGYCCCDLRVLSVVFDCSERDSHKTAGHFRCSAPTAVRISATVVAEQPAPRRENAHAAATAGATARAATCSPQVPGRPWSTSARHMPRAVCQVRVQRRQR